MSSVWSKRRRICKLVQEAERDIAQHFEYTQMPSSASPLDQNANHSLSGETKKEHPSPVSPLSHGSVCSGSLEYHVCRDSNRRIPDSQSVLHGISVSPGCVSSPGSDSSDSDCCDNESNESMLLHQLKDWATTFSISLVGLTALLNLLRMYHPHLPRDGRTLLGTQSHVATRKVGNGEYYHFGLEQGIHQKLKSLKIQSSLQGLKLQFNIDGLPLFRSSRTQLWPILCLADCDYSKSPFLVGLYCGVTKPASVFDYLADFVKDLTNVLEHGIDYNGKQLEVSVSAVVCDAPARAFVKNIKSHNGYSGCDKCMQVGKWHNKMTYPETNARPRTDSNFCAMADEEHHLEGKLGPLTGIVKMVSQFPLDYMHLCCLGVMRKLLLFWLKGKKLATRLPSKTVGLVSKNLLNQRPYTPSEFSRKPRELTEIDRWKATELRQFMIYTGPVVLKNCMPQEVYDNFMLFSVAMFLLLTPDISEEKLCFAGNILVCFVRHFGELYGKEEIVFNVHQLVHLADEYRRFGALDNVSAFPFENCLGRIKKLVRKPHQPLQQVVKRLSEMPTALVPIPTCSVSLQHKHHNGPLPPQFGTADQFNKITWNECTISTEPGDNCIEVGHEIAVVKNIVRAEDVTYVIYQTFKHKENSFLYPCASSYIGSYQVSGLHSNLGVCRVEHIQRKCALYKDRDSFIVIPLAHMFV
ncbi:uncharacterized protein LOC125799437 isoform X1 [Astyanax mexicanus]|uniref:uncharacterized protein LOC125799437 isoform X1 n=1 Tax=Astyanax mexicanus TaxID=7994 RepID=UPI0020CAFB1F|nr:uncharacterized protein LOC125799437 isoform X1 [Astyanax mexicanus]